MSSEYNTGFLGWPLLGRDEDTLRSPRKLTGADKFIRVIIPDSENRPEHDFYRTPEPATRCLLAREKLTGVVWEPACGDGAIARVLVEAGHRVYATDLVDRGYGETGVDFLAATAPDELGVIVTNPPFTLVQEFVEHALSFRPREVIILARLLWLEGKSRKAFFEATSLARVWVFSQRMNVSRNGVDHGDGGLGGMVAFAWFVWQRGWRSAPRLGWMPLVERIEY